MNWLTTVTAEAMSGQVISYMRGPLLFIFNFHPTNSYEGYYVGVEEAGEYQVRDVWRYSDEKGHLQRLSGHTQKWLQRMDIGLEFVVSWKMGQSCNLRMQRKSPRLDSRRKSYREDDGHERNGVYNSISAFKGCFFVGSARRAEWFQEQGRLLVKGRPVLLGDVEIHSEEVGEGNEGGKGIIEAGGLDEGETVGGDASKCRATSVA
ncbi:hypothetical protein CK203_041402 [Vitis vinifera]|uniref:Alpha-amylase/branching enzyme C-terminal all beta domain-containing protein n=1 Tax=Vitis vinifera TaxID=29760 RepID=A0A438H5S2_VITVI|nr:hypothetical protein CK203_041402 [Vitis vinifera]